jgi:predicted enzyme related to lactoylglutathione lyase
MFYSSQAPQLRAFFRDKLGLSCTDVGEGWLIFNFNQAELGCHESDSSDGKQSGVPHLSFYCDDIQKTMSELKQRGVEFTQDAVDEGYGLVTHFKVPGGFTVQLYQPRYFTRPRPRES